MNEISTTRYVLAGAPLVIIAVAYFLLHPLGLKLLSAPPGYYLPIIIVGSLIVALFSTFTFLRSVGSSFIAWLGRRLANILILALTLYASAEASRGFYAMTAFDGPLTTKTEQWPVVNFGPNATHMLAQRPNTTRPIDFAATPEAVAAVTGFGKCVSVVVERSADGAERIGSTQPVITPADLSPCPAGLIGTVQNAIPDGTASYRSNRSESAAEQSAADAIRARNDALRQQQPTPFGGGLEAQEDRRDDGVSFEPGQPMIDTTGDASGDE